MYTYKDIVGSANEKTRILEQISAITTTIRTDVANIALFGSCVKKSIPEANDVDVAIFLNNLDFNLIQKKLLAQATSNNIPVKRVDLKYGGNIIKTESKGYDIVLLDKRYPDKSFIKRNVDNLVFIDEALPSSSN